MSSPIVGDAGVCPSVSVWVARSEQFRRLEFLPLGFQSISLHPQLNPLIYELEHLYCAGAWLAVVVFSHSLVEVSLHSKNKGKKREWNKFLEPHALVDEVQWLNNRRNELLHIQSSESPSLTKLEEVVCERDSFFNDAKKAVSIAFRVVFLDTHSLNA